MISSAEKVLFEVTGLGIFGNGAILLSYYNFYFFPDFYIGSYAEY